MQYLSLKVIFLLLLTLVMRAHATDYFVSSSTGDDNNDGLTAGTPFQSIAKLNTLTLLPGDQVQFLSGDSWQGMFWPKGSGTMAQPIKLGVYGIGAKPIIDGDGYQASILLFNEDHYEITGLELTNQASHLDGGGAVKTEPGFTGAVNDSGSGQNVRFGIKIVASTRSLDGFTLTDLLIRDVYPSPANASLQHQGYGIKVESQSNAGSGNFYIVSNVLMEDLVVTRTGHYGVWIRPLGLDGNDDHKHENITLRNSQLLDTGGAGFVPVKASSVLVEFNTFDGTGSSLDARMWKRGSGLWPFDAKDVVIQNNTLMNARGPLDSYGVHIDYNNENVVVQYNYSYNNEGGFVQILGNNINSGYRYNISVADGYRLQGVNGGLQDGRIFNVSDFCNVPAGCQSVGNFIYNNTVFVPNTFSPDIVFQDSSGETFFHNNIIVVESGSSALLTSMGSTGVSYEIGNNLFFPQSLFALDPLLAVDAHFFSPGFTSAGQNNPDAYKLVSNSPAKSLGTIISGSSDPVSYRFNNGGKDYFGFSVSDASAPHLGAYNGNELLFSGALNVLLGWQTFETVVNGNNNSQISDATPDTNSTFDATPMGGISTSGHYLTGVIGAGASILEYAGHGANISSNFLNGGYFGGDALMNGEQQFIEDWMLADGSPGQRIGPFANPNNNMGSSWKFRENDSRRRGDFKITNHSDYYFDLETVHFVARIGTANSANNLELIYLPGAVDDSDGVELRKLSDGLEVGDTGGGPVQTSVYNTEDPGLADFGAAPDTLGISRTMDVALGTRVYLAPGKSASFRFIWTGQASNFAESQIDNLAVEGTFYQTAALSSPLNPVDEIVFEVPILTVLAKYFIALGLGVIGAASLARREFLENR